MPDATPFEDLLQRFLAPLRRLAWAYTHDKPEADELLQEHSRYVLIVTDGEPTAHRFLVALRRFWLVRNHYTQARAFLAPMLARYAAPTAARLDLLEASNTFATLQLEYDTALDNVLLVGARIGGDRFAVLLPVRAEADSLRAWPVRVIEALSRPFCIAACELSLGAHVGAAQFPGRVMRLECRDFLLRDFAQ